MKFDALYRLTTIIDKIIHVDNNEISVFLFDETNLELERNRSPDESTSSTSSKMTLMNCAQEWTDINSPQLSCNWSEARKFSKHGSTICFAPKYNAHLTKEAVQFFEIDVNGLIVFTTDKGIQIGAPHSMKYWFLYINHWSLFCSHVGGRKLYYKILLEGYLTLLAFYWNEILRMFPRCARNRFILNTNVKILQLFQA